MGFSRNYFKKPGAAIACYLMAGMLCGSLPLAAQVKIGGPPGPPVSSAVLELDGQGLRGLRLPGVNSKDELADIVNPVNGLVVFGNHTGSIWYHYAGGWYELIEPAPTFTLPHTGFYNYSSETVLKVTNTANNGRGFHATTFNSYAVLGSNTSGVAISGQTAEGTALEGLALTGTALKARSHSGTSAYFSRGSFTGNALIVDTGKVGIGTTSPDALLEIDATKYGSLPMRITGTNPTVQFKHETDVKSFIQQSESQLMIGMLGIQATDRISLASGGFRRLSMDGSGRFSLGSNAEQWSGILNIKSALSGPGLLIETTNPEIRFRSDEATLSRLWFTSNELRLQNDLQHDLVLRTNSSDRMRVDGANGNIFMNGRLGVGAEATTARLQVDAVGLAATETISVNDEAPLVALKASGVSKGFLQLTGDDMKIGTNAGIAAGRVIMRTGGVDWFNMNASGNASFLNTLSINTDDVASGYVLNVRGRMIGEEIRIQNFAAWPDYVFDPAYKLMTLNEVAAHIEAHHHLPGIPNAALVEKEGFDVGSMEAKLLQKVEELTLYLIEANKRIEALEQKLSSKKTLKKAGK